MFLPPHQQPQEPARAQYSLYFLAAATAAVAVLLAVLRLDWPLGGKIVVSFYGFAGLVTILLLTRHILDWNRPDS